MTTTSNFERRREPGTIGASLHFEELARLADLAASYWQSIALAADRGEIVTVAVHMRQAVAVTRETVAIVNTLRAPDADERAAA